jgi:hypothetical protein
MKWRLKLTAQVSLRKAARSSSRQMTAIPVYFMLHMLIASVADGIETLIYMQTVKQNTSAFGKLCASNRWLQIQTSPININFLYHSAQV